MSRKLITQQDIIRVAEELVLLNYNPTVAAIRKKLNNGSATTIYKYLKQWKQKCFKKNISSFLQNEIQINGNKKSLSYEFLEEKYVLEQVLNKQIAKNECYSQELINAEKANVSLKEEIYQLQITNQELQLKLSSAEATNKTLDKVIEKIQNELNLNTNETIQKMQEIIDGLRLELKTVNETSIIALRETINQGHEALMQEKVTSINLQAKIYSLTKELLESKKQSNEAIMATQVQIRALSRQHEKLQKIIQEHGLDKLPQLKEELSLKFSKEAGSYGK